MKSAETHAKTRHCLLSLLGSLLPLPVSELFGLDEGLLGELVARQLIEPAGFNEDCMPLYQITAAGVESLQ